MSPRDHMQRLADALDRLSEGTRQPVQTRRIAARWRADALKPES